MEIVKLLIYNKKDDYFFSDKTFGIIEDGVKYIAIVNHKGFEPHSINEYRSDATLVKLEDVKTIDCDDGYNTAEVEYYRTDKTKF